MRKNGWRRLRGHEWPMAANARALAERDEVDPEGDVERWVVIGHSPYQHYPVSVETVGRGPEKVDMRTAACGYSYQRGFEVIPDGDCGLPRCPRCLAVIVETDTAAGGRR